MPSPCELGKWSKRKKDNRGVSRRPEKLESADGKYSLNLRVVGRRDLHLAHRFQRVFQRRTLRSLHYNDQITLVILRNKSSRNLLVQKICADQRNQKRSKRSVSPHACEHAAHGGLIPVGAGGDHMVECAKEASLHSFPVMPQEDRRQGGRKRQRVERGNGHGKRDR